MPSGADDGPAPAGSAFAEDSKAEGGKELPKAVADLGIPGAKVDKTFDTGLEGINGWVISVENDTNVIYTTEDGKHAFVGMILGEGGENLTQAHMEEHMENSPLANMPGRAGASQADNGYSDDEEAKALELTEKVKELELTSKAKDSELEEARARRPKLPWWVSMCCVRGAVVGVTNDPA